MKKLTFKVDMQNKQDIIALTKEVNNLTCRIQIDIENGFVIAQEIDEVQIDTVIELINKYYSILSVDIDNTLQTEQKNTADFKQEKLEPKSEEDLIIEKVKFKNEHIEEIVNKLLKTVGWAIEKRNIPEKEIGEFIWTAINEISFKYGKNDIVPFEVGDVVDCNFGAHPNEEINGYHIPAIVCDTSYNNLVYVVPIGKTHGVMEAKNSLEYTTPTDISFDDFANGKVLLYKGRYVIKERIHKVIGQTSSNFFEQVLSKLPSIFNFTKAGETNCIKAVTMKLDENTTIKTLGNEEEEDTTEIIVESLSSKEQTKSEKPNVNNEEILLQTFDKAFSQLDQEKNIQEKIDIFLEEIGMPRDNQLLKKSFNVVYNMTPTKINYATIAKELQKENQELTTDNIISSLKKEFKNWLKQNSNLEEKCYRVSLVYLWKAFAKKCA